MTDAQERQQVSRKTMTVVAIISAAGTALAAVVALLAYLDSRPSGGGSIAGTWSAIDTGDQSRMTLRVNLLGGSTYQVILEDSLASGVCGTAAATVTSTGNLTNDRLVASGTVICADGKRVEQPVTITYTYFPESDSITDDASGAAKWIRD
ncbi:hypothetical protein AB0B31_05745 [Catellatospora citrea]|uniref:hypothetical protein n=1 Tax=Catellatospora citrea TaxID=53366 RepID=UPI0033F6B779